MTKKKAVKEPSMVIVNRRSYKRKPEFYESYDPKDPNCKSRTVPDMSMSIKELITRYTRGQEIPEWIEGVGYENPEDVPVDMPDVEKMRRVEKLQYADQLRDIVEEGKKDLAGIKIIHKDNLKDNKDEPTEADTDSSKDTD